MYTRRDLHLHVLFSSHLEDSIMYYVMFLDLVFVISVSLCLVSVRPLPPRSRARHRSGEPLPGSELSLYRPSPASCLLSRHGEIFQTDNYALHLSALPSYSNYHDVSSTLQPSILNYHLHRQDILKSPSLYSYPI